MTSQNGDSAGRFDGRVVVIMGAGQTPGPTIGNGRATAELFARRGAHVIAVDRDLAVATCRPHDPELGLR